MSSPFHEARNKRQRFSLKGLTQAQAQAFMEKYPLLWEHCDAGGRFKIDGDRPEIAIHMEPSFIALLSAIGKIAKKEPLSHPDKLAITQAGERIAKQKDFLSFMGDMSVGARDRAEELSRAYESEKLQDKIPERQDAASKYQDLAIAAGEFHAAACELSEQLHSAQQPGFRPPR